MGLAVENDDFIDIFVEEVDDVLLLIGKNLPLWKANPQNKVPLIEIQRAFYTLKSSGRMVDANQISELAFAVENLLNRLISGDLTYHISLYVLVEKSFQTIPLLAKALRNRQAAAIAGVNVSALIKQIHDFNQGHENIAQPVFSQSNELRDLEIEQLDEKLNGLNQSLLSLRQDWQKASEELAEVQGKLRFEETKALAETVETRLKQFAQNLHELEYSIKKTGESVYNDAVSMQQRLNQQIEQELRIAKDVVAQLKADQHTERQVIYTEMNNQIKAWAIGAGVVTFIMMTLTSIFLL